MLFETLTFFKRESLSTCNALCVALLNPHFIEYYHSHNTVVAHAVLLITHKFEISSYYRIKNQARRDTFSSGLIILMVVAMYGVYYNYKWKTGYHLNNYLFPSGSFGIDYDE